MAHNDLFRDIKARVFLDERLAAYEPSSTLDQPIRGQVTQHVLDSGVLVTTYGDVTEYRMAAPVEAAVEYVPLATWYLDQLATHPFMDAADAFDAASRDLGFEGEWDEPFEDDDDPTWFDIGTCGGCGAYGKLGLVHVRPMASEGGLVTECGEYI